MFCRAVITAFKSPADRIERGFLTLTPRNLPLPSPKNRIQLSDLNGILTVNGGNLHGYVKGPARRGSLDGASVFLAFPKIPLRRFRADLGMLVFSRCFAQMWLAKNT